MNISRLINSFDYVQQVSRNQCAVELYNYLCPPASLVLPFTRESMGATFNTPPNDVI